VAVGQGEIRESSEREGQHPHGELRIEAADLGIPTRDLVWGGHRSGELPTKRGGEHCYRQPSEGRGAPHFSEERRARRGVYDDRAGAGLEEEAGEIEAQFLWSFCDERADPPHFPGIDSGVEDAALAAQEYEEAWLLAGWMMFEHRKAEVTWMMRSIRDAR
jgi:hypothetical protein